MSLDHHRLLHAGALLLLPLALAACSSGSGTGAAPSTGSSPAAKTSAPADPNAGLLTGRKLKTLLLPASSMPRGFKESPDGAVNTGDTFTPPSSGPVPAGSACNMLTSTSWIRAAGIGSASFAQNDYADGSTGQFAQEIDDFRGAGARAVMSRLNTVFRGCAAFKGKSDQGTFPVKLRTSPLPGVGDEAFKAVMTSSAWQGGETMVAARVGNSVVTTFYSSSGSDNGAAVVPMTKRLVENLKSASTG